MKINLPFFLTLCLLLSCSNILDPSEAEKAEFSYVYSLLKKHSLYSAKIDVKSTYNRSIDELIKSLDDPFSAYYEPETANQIINDLKTPAVQKIIGIQTRPQRKDSTHYADTLEIFRVLPNSPALKSGLMSNDLITSINNTPLGSEAGEISVNFLNLIQGDSLSIGIKRGDSLFNVNVIKDNTPIPSVYVDSVSNDIHLIHITQFVESSLDGEVREDSISGTWLEFRDALIKTNSDKATIVDLRGNGGGSVSQCVRMANEFIKSGDTIVVFDDRTNEPDQNGLHYEYIIAGPSRLAGDRKFILLINSGTASCAEIFYIALKENRNFPSVGEKTYGKGIGQSLVQTPTKALLKFTSLEILDKNLKPYNGIGLSPDYQFSSPFDQLDKAIELAQDVGPSILYKVNPYLNHSTNVQSLNHRHLERLITIDPDYFLFHRLLSP
jgi:C-terminal peptidase prc